MNLTRSTFSHAGYGMAAFLLSVFCFSARAVTLAWTDSPSANVTGYALCWSTNAGGPYLTRTNTGNVNQFSLTNRLFMGQTTYFVVVALDTNNWLESDPSNEVSMTLPNLLPPVQNDLSVASTLQSARDPLGPWCDETTLAVLSIPVTPGRQFYRAQLKITP